jgi:CubicO group peptidase (beta-lactamase class C family)
MHATIEAVKDLLQRAAAAGLIPGGVAGWSTGAREPTLVPVGQVTVNGRARPAAVGDWFDLASLTKPLATTTLFLLALREGRLDLATRVGEVLTEVAHRAVGELTMVELLTHTSGLPDWQPIYALARGDRRQAEVTVLELALVHDRSHHVVYSCPGFIILGLVLARVWGAPLDTCLTGRVLVPLGLTGELGFRPDPGALPVVDGAGRPSAETELVAQAGLDPVWVPPGSVPDDGNARFLDGVAGNAGLFGTARGVVQLARQFLSSSSQLLEQDEVIGATQCRTAGLEQRRGLGWQLAGTPGCSAGGAVSRRAFGHTGFTGSSVWVDPERELVMTLLAHRHHPTHRGVDLHPLRRRFHSIVVGGMG